MVKVLSIFISWPGANVSSAVPAPEPSDKASSTQPSRDDASSSDVSSEPDPTDMPRSVTACIVTPQILPFMTTFPAALVVTAEV